MLDIGSPGSGWLSTTFIIRSTEAGFLDEDGSANGFMIDETYEDMGVKAKVPMKQDSDWARWVLEGTIHIKVDPDNAASSNETYSKWFHPVLDILETVDNGDATAQATIIAIAYTDPAENSGTATTTQISLSVKATSQTSGSTQDQTSEPNEQVEQTGQTSQAGSTQQEPAQDSQSPAASEPELKDITTTPPDGNPDDDIELPVPDDDGSRPIPIAFNTATIALIVISLLAGVVLAILYLEKVASISHDSSSNAS